MDIIYIDILIIPISKEAHMRQLKQQQLPMDLGEPIFALVAETPKDIEKRQKAAAKNAADIQERNRLNLLSKTPRLF